jgi:hypothetical protein
MFKVQLDAGTTHLTIKRFGMDGLNVVSFDSYEAAAEYAKARSAGMKGREIAVVGSEDGVFLAGFQDGFPAERRGPAVKRVEA